MHCLGKSLDNPLVDALHDHQEDDDDGGGGD
eukprot:CAMPEP_0197857562 /NCGR_PEP_ID=MMETSP1438-20131217/30740_1 /TAXON_ID=1461541 /ORGANISM="Pterosperma sp., Strain CCMP1384" /LENGTH=30 /DNA_ID= /DNA_START= /DNA_END= /DNA_ORIENTATION=